MPVVGLAYGIAYTVAASRLGCMLQDVFRGSESGSLKTATLRRELKNCLGANSLLDLVFSRQAADTTIDFCTSAVVLFPRFDSGYVFIRQSQNFRIVTWISVFRP